KPDPMIEPSLDGLRVMAQRLHEIAQHAQIVDRMDVASNRLRQRADAGARRGMAGQQWRRGMRLVEILDDGERLDKDLAILLKRRHQALRLQRKVVCLLLLV